MVAVREASAEGSPEALLPGTGFRGPTLLHIGPGPAVPVAVPFEAEPEPEITRLSEVLEGWRAAERAVGEHLGGSRENAVMEAEVRAWRAAYHRIFAERRGQWDTRRTDDPWTGPI